MWRAETNSIHGEGIVISENVYVAFAKTLISTSSAKTSNIAIIY